MTTTSDPSSYNTGDLALSGEEEYLSAHLFPALEEDVWITTRGSLILVFDPGKPQDIIWKWDRVDEYTTDRVPKGCRIKVLHGWVRMSTSVSG